ncbi:UvrABC system protein A [Streptomyces microflavus]
MRLTLIRPRRGRGRSPERPLQRRQGGQSAPGHRQGGAVTAAGEPAQQTGRRTPHRHRGAVRPAARGPGAAGLVGQGGGGDLRRPGEAVGEEDHLPLREPLRQVLQRIAALPQRAKKALLYGHKIQTEVRYRNRYGRERAYTTPAFEGAVQFVKRRHTEAESDSSRERFEGYMREVPCPTCEGTRLDTTVAPARGRG